MSRSAALETLLAGLVDYAGLFPPAGLDMPRAVSAYARYAAGNDRAMLGRFVLPVARLDEFVAARDAVRAHAARSAGAPEVVALRASFPWRLSVLAGAADAPTLEAFNAREESVSLIDTVEARADAVAEVEALAHALGAYTTFVEIPVREDPTALIAAIGARGLRAKIRTGGVTPEAFPSAQDVLRFLDTCTRLGVPFKATAGLHHPLRGEYPLTYAPDAVRGTMYGFLNIFLTAALLRAGVTAAEVAPLLEERDPAAIVVRDGAIAWRGNALTTTELAETRAALAGSFGSCSFEEPVRDLTSLNLR